MVEGCAFLAYLSSSRVSGPSEHERHRLTFFGAQQVKEGATVFDSVAWALDSTRLLGRPTRLARLCLKMNKDRG
jgi:hypothetical protein